jgi:hypothetical protein
MDKAVVEVLDNGECAESDPSAGVNGKHMLPDDFVAMVLAMPRETPRDTEGLSYITDLGKLLGQSEGWSEEQEKLYRERAALFNRINDQFVQFQDSIRDKWISQGYVEAEGDFDANLAEVQEFSSQLWKKNSDFSGLG